MKQCQCGNRMTAYRSVNRGDSMLRYLRCKTCHETGKELVPLDQNGRAKVSSSSLPTVGKPPLACPQCGHTLKAGE